MTFTRTERKILLWIYGVKIVALIYIGVTWTMQDIEFWRREQEFCDRDHSLCFGRTPNTVATK